VTAYFASDTHFLHRFVASLRGFASPAEHDELIISRWNKRVRPADFAWLLGDVGLGRETGILELAARLNGRKQLVTGNHDAPWSGHRKGRASQRRWLEVFETVQPFARTTVAGQDVLLSHFPYAGDHTPSDRGVQYRLRNEGAWLLHGHTHESARISGRRQIHVGLDAWDLTPVSEAEIAALMNQAEQQVTA
jgi:calcineurin-like phosphoesterase family protein